MERREFLETGAAAGLGTLGLGLAGLAVESTAEAKHDHKKVNAKVRSYTSKEKKVIRTAEDCLEKANACIPHCVAQLAAGNPNMKGCLESVLQMREVVEASRNVIAMKTASPALISSIMNVCAKFCDDCKVECGKHAKMHKKCRDCRDACKKCAAACRALA